MNDLLQRYTAIMARASERNRQRLEDLVKDDPACLQQLVEGIERKEYALRQGDARAMQAILNSEAQQAAKFTDALKIDTTRVQAQQSV